MVEFDHRGANAGVYLKQLITGQYLSRESARTPSRRDELNGEISGGSGENSPPNNWVFYSFLVGSDN